MGKPRHMKTLRCISCHVGGVKIGTAPDGRAQFTCTRCGRTWTNGKDTPHD